MKRAFRTVADALHVKKLTMVSVSKGRTSWLKTPADQQDYDVRFDFAKQTTSLEGHQSEVFNNFQVQSNADKIPSTFRN